MTRFSQILANARRLFRGPGQVAPIAAPVDPQTASRIEALRDETTELRRQLNDVKSELYGIGIAYSRDHFELYEKMRAQQTETLRRSGVTGDLALLRRRCAELEASISGLRRRLADAGVDGLDDLAERHDG